LMLMRRSRSTRFFDILELDWLYRPASP